MTSEAPLRWQPGDLVRARGREWVVLPETRAGLLRLRPLGGSEADAELIYLPLEPQPPAPASFSPPDPNRPGSQAAAVLLRDALRLKLRAGAGPFRSFGNLAVEPRAYQLVPLLMALKLDPIRLLIADDVGIGKTIEAALIAREMLDRGEIERFSVICPPHLCEQWQQELASKFNLRAEVVRPGTAARLERDLRPDESVFSAHPFTVVSLDYIKSDRRRADFLRTCPELVIVDEAHSCVQASTSLRHQRYLLVKGLAEAAPARHMLFLTATPHSGDDAAFHNLLGLLRPDFARLAQLPEGEERRQLREQLAQHLVQRRRGDIAEWRDSAGFPLRESREATYALAGESAKLFEDVLGYARAMVRRAEGGSKLEQRMSWWAALALLRCASSSPAALALALRTRLRRMEGLSESEQLAELDLLAAETVLDGAGEDGLGSDETVPAGTTEAPSEAAELRQLIQRAEALRGPERDAKLAALAAEIQQLLADGFRPVIFCRYIATAHYLADCLGELLPAQVQLVTVTGELAAEQREERVEELAGLAEGRRPVLVATDCLSEGVNLQNFFDAAVHYDLSWNPTRHEQREGRVDRFGQAARVVRALMLYGENNPVDGAVLQVILRKAERIRKELGVAVPLPTDNTRVIEAILQAVLLHSGRVYGQQLALEFTRTEAEVEGAWRAAQERMTRTVFAQRRLQPEAVLPEWRKANEVLGGAQDVARFVEMAARHLGAALERRSDHALLAISQFPAALREQLEALGLRGTLKVGFSPSASGALQLHRSHPLVATLADYLAEDALEGGEQGLAARCAAMFTAAVDARTAIYLLRLRYQIEISRRDSGEHHPPGRFLLAEECLGLAVRGAATPQVLPEADALALLSAEPAKNMEEGQKIHLITQAVEQLAALREQFGAIARRRADALLADHRRVREASELRGVRYAVSPALPVDIVGVYLLVPLAGAR
jgi:superfamily II DNA or RNA helicase